MAQWKINATPTVSGNKSIAIVQFRNDARSRVSAAQRYEIDNTTPAAFHSTLCKVANAYETKERYVPHHVIDTTNPLYDENCASYSLRTWND